MKKTCKECGKEKHLNEFYWQNIKENKKHGICITCFKQKQLEKSMQDEEIKNNLFNSLYNENKDLKAELRECKRLNRHYRLRIDNLLKNNYNVK